MAIIIHTGLPGHGKTLYTLWYVRDWADREGRQVYYHGIPELQIPGWIELDDATTWYQLPPRSIVVVDEAQKTFRPRSSGAGVPAHVAAAETHRHAGIDAVLITQHPLLIDGNIRRLCDKHRHIIRAFGAPYATVHEWPQVMDQPQKQGSRKDSIKSQFRYPKEVYRWYKSAEAHTYKTRIPAKVWGAIALTIGLVVGIYGVVQWFKGGLFSSSSPVAQSVETVAQGSVLPQPSRERRQVKTTAEWLQEQQPRIAGLPHTAPMYDNVTQARYAPYPAACIASASRCVCYTQQGTRIGADDKLCRQIAETGYFVAWDTGEQRSERREVTAPSPAEDVHQESGVMTASRAWGGVPARDSWGGVR